MSVTEYCQHKRLFWNFKKKLYHLFRHKFVFGYFLRQENLSLSRLFSEIPNELSNIFDLGTGTGNALECLNISSVKFGIDSNFEMLQYARNRIAADFIHCDVKHLSVKDDAADFVLLIGVLEYFFNVDDIFSEIQRVTKEGSFVIFSFAEKNPLNLLRNFLGHKIYTLELDEVKELLKKHDFKLINHHRLILQNQILIKKIC